MNQFMLVEMGVCCIANNIVMQNSAQYVGSLPMWLGAIKHPKKC
jgi:hypothetical protein